MAQLPPFSTATAPLSITVPRAEPHVHSALSVFKVNWLSAYLLVWQAALVLLFSFATTIPQRSDIGSNRYAMWQDTHTMMTVGFGFLYTLLRRYAWSGIALNFLLAALVLQWALITNGFWSNVSRLTVSPPTLAAGSFPAIPLTLEALIGGDYTVATILISLGAVLGRVSPSQLVIMAFAETVLASGNAALATSLGVSDAGGSMVIHSFGAAFGLAFATVIGDAAARGRGNGEAVLGTTRANGTFAMIGTAFLFLFWPSFNAGLLHGASAERAVINTVVSICASVVTAFACSRAIHAGARFDMEHIQNATLAGGVAIGAACDMITNPGGAAATGVVAGAVSVYGFSFLSPLLKRHGITDVCGIVNLHLLPGILGGVASAIAAGTMDAGGSGFSAATIATEFPGRGTRSALVAGGYQMAVTVISLSIGAVGGAAIGALVKTAPWAEPMTDFFYEDAGQWNVPLEGEEAPELEADVTRTLDNERAVLADALSVALFEAVGKALGKDLPRPRGGKLGVLLGSGGGGSPYRDVTVHGASPRRSANERFRDGSVHGGTVGERSLHGRREASAHGRSPLVAGSVPPPLSV